MEEKKRKAAIEAILFTMGDAVELNTRTQSDLVKMLVSGAKKRGAALQTDQARYLISVVGTDMQTLLHELDKLSAFCKDGEATPAAPVRYCIPCLNWARNLYRLRQCLLIIMWICTE